MPECLVEGCLAKAGVGFLQSVWERSFWECVWPCLDPWDSVRLRTASTCWNVSGKCGPYGELFFFLPKKEPVVASDDEASNPCVSAETLKACEHFVTFLNECFPSFQTCLCVLCKKFRRSKGGGTTFWLGVGHSWKERFSSSQRRAPIFSCHRRAHTGLNHVVRVSNHMQN